MGDQAVNEFFNYVNQLIYTENSSLIEAIHTYLIDNNIPYQYKQMNCIQDNVNVIANRFNNEMIQYNNYINNQNIPHNLSATMVRTLLDIQNVQNILNNYRMNI